ncbi:hypothetical protein [Nocardioides sp. MH1]|uniref:hypothetical protein n=1 Tax=Nocardioides sp. MH1 TaxID=3242490 RepID=UPI003522003D
MGDHKYARARIEVRTSLPSCDAMTLATRVAEATRVTGWKYNKKVAVRLVETSPTRATFEIGQKRPLLVFDVHVGDVEQGSWLVSEITGYTTTQDTIGGFIPAGAKNMEGYPWYRQFMVNLAATVGSADPASTVTMVEREA